MSVFKPDIFDPEKEKEEFYITFPDNTIKPEIPKEESKMSLDDLKKSLDEYVKNFDGDMEKLYEYALISSKTTSHTRNSIHYLHLLSTYLLITLRKLNPDKNFENVEKFLENAKLELEKILKDDNVSNELYIPCILGIYRGLI
jgi:hypothetical protein